VHDVEIVIGLLAGVALLGAIAERAGLPYAAVLVLGGLLVALIPGMPIVRLRPQLVLLGFLPPLVFATAFRAAGYDLRPNVADILTLSTGLVLLTVVAVAAVGRAVAGLPWVSALVLGALAAPTDPVSASSVMRHIGAPERVVSILEGESLVNDGTGLAAFQVAVAAAAGGISVADGLLRFVGISVGGCAIGLVVGWALVQLRRRLDEASLEIVLGLLAAFGSYVAAYALGCSGVLAAVAAGLYAGRQAEDISSADTRLSMEPFWTALTFVLESMLFLLIGLQLPAIVPSRLGGLPASWIGYGALVVGVVLAVRAAWMVALRAAPRRERLPGRELTLLGYSGMRGALSLAGALSIPLVVAHHAFPARDEVIVLVYIVVLGTLVVPSLTLEALVRRLGLTGGFALQRQEIAARTRIARAGLERLDELAPDSGVPPSSLDRLEARSDRAGARRGEGGDQQDVDLAVGRLRRAVIAAEREALAELRRDRAASSQTLAQIQRDIDLDETRLH